MASDPVAVTSEDEKLDLELVEIQLLTEGIYRHYGFDFRDYSVPSLRRRIWKRIYAEGLSTVAGLIEKVLHDPQCMERLLLDLSINTTAMFRDPTFYLSFRRKVVPILRTYPYVRLWHAGCSTGEEVYSMAILLEEEGIYDRCRIYATDMNEAVLKQAREGIFPLNVAEQYRQNYVQSGGAGSFDDYYTGAYGSGIFRASLKRNVIFSQHNLATDGSFNEFHIIMCRNVMIYFKKSLQNRVHDLLYDSLNLRGVLGIGSKESIQFTPHEKDYETLQPGVKLFRRIR